MRYVRHKRLKAEQFGANQQIKEAFVPERFQSSGQSSAADEFGGRFHQFKVDVTQSKQTMLNQEFPK